MGLLKNFTLLDLGLRLPGPLAGKLFTDLGARVIKVEDENFKDPFLNGLFNQKDDHFINWYNKLNSKKEIVRFDFKGNSAKEKMHKLLSKANALIFAGPEKVGLALGISKELIEENHPHLTVINLKASEGKIKNLHDLNALAEAGLLDMHLNEKDTNIISPPFLPVSGISFGHWICTKLLAAKVSGTPWVEASLQEATENVLLPFSSSKKGAPRYLHNGKFPCYCLYKTADEKILAVAAVENKFWERFNQIFALELAPEQRFDTSEKTFKVISKKIRSLNSSQIAELLENQDICVTLA